MAYIAPRSLEESGNNSSLWDRLLWKVAVSKQISGILIIWFLGPIRVLIRNGISIGSAVSAGLTNVTNIHITDTQTHTHTQRDRLRYSICSKRPVSLCIVMLLWINLWFTRVVFEFRPTIAVVESHHDDDQKEHRTPATNSSSHLVIYSLTEYSCSCRVNDAWLTSVIIACNRWRKALYPVYAMQVAFIRHHVKGRKNRSDVINRPGPLAL